MNTPETSKATALVKLDKRSDGSIELQYANSGVPIAVLCYSGTATQAIGELIARCINEHAALVAVAEAAQLAHAGLVKLGSTTGHESDWLNEKQLRSALAHLAAVRERGSKS